MAPALIASSIFTELARFARRNTLAAAGGLVGSLIVFMALAAPLLAPRDPLKADFRRMTKPPDAQSLLGTDQVGRDTLSRVIYGARTSLFVAFSAVIMGTTVGSLWGVACGYLRGRFDLVSQRIMEILQSFPDLILAMAISMAIGTGLPAVIFAIAITRIPFGGRVIRSVALSIREMAYVEAGRASGASAARIMIFHVLPQCIAPYLVLATTHLGVAIVIEAALGFLGVGVPPPTPTWGNMLADSSPRSCLRGGSCSFRASPSPSPCSPSISSATGSATRSIRGCRPRSCVSSPAPGGRGPSASPRPRQGRRR